MSFSFSSTDLARLFSSPDIKQSTVEIIIDRLLRYSFDGKYPTTDGLEEALENLGISFDPLAILEEFKIVEVRSGKIILHPIVSEELNLWRHLLEILRNRFGVLVSRRIFNLGRYLQYIDNLPGQVQFLELNMNIEQEILLDAIKSLFTIRIDEQDHFMSFQEALRFYKKKENLNSKARNALRALSENMHLITKNDVKILKKTMHAMDEVAAQVDMVRREFTRFSVDALLSGMVKLEDIMEFKHTDELVTLSLLMKMSATDGFKALEVDEKDPISRLIKQFLQRDMPMDRKRSIINMIASFFREFFIREGFTKDLHALIQSFFHKEFDLKKTLFKTMKKMEIWTPVYRQKIKASSRNMILVNDLSGSMIASYIGQVELYLGLVDAITQEMDSEIIFISFSNDTLALNYTKMKEIRGRDEFLEVLTRNTMGMTDINMAIETILTGIPTRGDSFTPPDPGETIVFFVSDLQETIGGRLDMEKAREMIHSCRKFFLSVPRDTYNRENYQLFLELGAVPIFYDRTSEIPLEIMKLMKQEMSGSP
ncbi:VWA domain-containing protein [Candidatus Bathyarchaeota archaeon]|nr:VWA domain-containing protein [Candidatus Bathyarchaeota archaeon]